MNIIWIYKFEDGTQLNLLNTNLSAEEFIKLQDLHGACFVSFKSLKVNRENEYVNKTILKDRMIEYGFISPDMTVTEFVEDCLPSVQSEGWIERNKARILQAGKEGREVEFRIDGRLFAIREKAQ